VPRPPAGERLSSPVHVELQHPSLWSFGNLVLSSPAQCRPVAEVRQRGIRMTACRAQAWLACALLPTAAFDSVNTAQGAPAIHRTRSNLPVPDTTRTARRSRRRSSAECFWCLPHQRFLSAKDFDQLQPDWPSRYDEDGEEDAAPEPSPAVHPEPTHGTAAHPEPAQPAEHSAEEEFYEDEGGGFNVRILNGFQARAAGGALR